MRRRLEAADRRCGLPPISAERLAELRGKSGSGATTLLLSHLSADHTVFAADQGSGSISNVRRSSLLRSSVVTFVEGATQRTLPQYKFTEPLQLVLIDGPHAYPFPDLEYYFLYPPLETGALLVVDDIHIRSVHNFFEFLRHDAMFELEEVAHTTASFTRTQAPVFDPLGDSWWTQRYNAKPLLRYTWKERFKTSIPTRFSSDYRVSAGARKRVNVRLRFIHHGRTR